MSAARHTPGENPRWTLCRQALGREPKAYEFMVWLSPFWVQFARLHGVRDSQGVELKLGIDETRRAFDAWLAEQVNSPKIPDGSSAQATGGEP